MNKISRLFGLSAALVISAGVLGGCTDAQLGKLGALGDNAKVECYSGGKQIYSGFSTGKVSSEKNSDGYYFVDKNSGKTMEVSGNCVITYDP